MSILSRIFPNKKVITIITNIVSMREYALTYSDRSDSIYSPELELLPNPFHECGNSQTDLSGKNVLLSSNFIYFGHKHIAVPDNLKNIIPGRGHQYNPNEPYKTTVVELFNKQKRKKGTGKIGKHNNKKKKRVQIKKTKPCEKIHSRKKTFFCPIPYKIEN